MSGVQSVERAFAVLRCLSGGPAGVTDVADRVNLPKSTVSRMLSTLEDLDMVEQMEPGGSYRIGAGMVEIAAAVLPGRTLIAAVRPHLHSLVKATGEAAGLSIADGFDILYLDQVDADNQVQVRDWTGERLRAHAVSSGQVLLAFGAIDADKYLDQPLERSASGTLTDASAIRSRLADIAKKGYAWAFEEFLDGLNSVAAPVRDATGRVVAAIHAHGPAYRFPGDVDADEVGRLVVATASRVQL
ncbi:MAG TPA: IclR family transcriptional regulator [Ilumatobacteraceae bacterium]|jgi:DNA-binding IclR family transcriptional regulator